MYSSDDMGWLCTWGGDPLLQWERVGLRSDDPAVVEHVDYWMWKETVHVHFVNTDLSEIHRDNLLLHMYVAEQRAQSDYDRALGRSHYVPP